MSDLRRVLGRARDEDSKQLIVTRVPGYQIQLWPDQLDLDHFEHLDLEGRRALSQGQAQEARIALRDALALWRGPALADFAYEVFAQSSIVRLEELRLAALEDRIEAELLLGMHHELVAELGALVVDHPFRERLREQLMLSLYRSGRQAEALSGYQETRRALLDEFGIEPGERLKRLELAILHHDPSLEFQPPALQVGPGRVRGAG